MPDVVQAPLEVHREVARRLSCAGKGAGKAEAAVASVRDTPHAEEGRGAPVVEAWLRDEAFRPFDEALRQELVDLAAGLRVEVARKKERYTVATSPLSALPIMP